MIFCMLCEDIFFYFSHRILHMRQIYPYIHKVHHQHKVTVSMGAIYHHPLEFVFGNVVPTASGPLILGSNMHITAAFTWYAIRVIETLEAHSGYDFSWSPFSLLPFKGDPGYHNFHHIHNVGNYSSIFTIWDSLLGSNKAYFKYKEEQKKQKVN